LNTQILAIIIVLFISALFSGLEFAYIKTLNLKKESDKKQANFGFKIISNILNEPGVYTTTRLLGTFILLTIHICLFTRLLMPQYQYILNSEIIGISIQLIIASFIFLVFAEIFPGIVYNINPSKTLNLIAIPVAIVYFLLYPITKPLFGLSLLTGKIFFTFRNSGKNEIRLLLSAEPEGLSYSPHNEKDGETEIEHDIKIFQNALDFSKVKLRDCAIPRNEIEAVELNSPIDKLKEKFIETGFSKILIYQESIDNIIGYAQSVDMFQSPENISSILKNLMIVPETMPANKLLNQFLKEHKSIALVVDEFGGTYGMATIEDIIEEIFGEIEDEHDSSEFHEEQISEKEFIFSGRLEIDYINEKYNIDIPESDDYATIAGYIFHHNEEIPIENDKLKIGKFEIEILKIRNPKIELIRLKYS
jgi:CBS domain containing-hemolysin-like protein